MGHIIFWIIVILLAPWVLMLLFSGVVLLMVLGFRMVGLKYEFRLMERWTNRRDGPP